jgi:hypothetical protein
MPGHCPAPDKGIPMKQTIVHYKTKPAALAENTRLIENVFAELRAKPVDGVRYLTLKLGDGSFLHFTTMDGDGINPITQTDSFRGYLAGIRDRVEAPPYQTNDVTIVGNYRMLGE